jgi:hypothetical protein
MPHSHSPAATTNGPATHNTGVVITLHPVFMETNETLALTARPARIVKIERRSIDKEIKNRSNNTQENKEQN